MASSVATQQAQPGRPCTKRKLARRSCEFCVTEWVSLDLQFRKLAALVPKHPWGFSHVGKRDVESGGSSAAEDCVDSDEEAGPVPDPVSTIVL